MLLQLGPDAAGGRHLRKLVNREPGAGPLCPAQVRCYHQNTMIPGRGGRRSLFEEIRSRGVWTALLLMSCSNSGDGTVSNAGDGGGSFADAGHDEDAACVPETCDQLGASCGDVVDRCGNVLSCGTCPSGQTCGAIEPNVCDEGTCTPKTCIQLGAACGLINDGCAGVLDCGTCPEGVVCGESAPNQCGACTPECTDRACGPDGCGGDCLPGCGAGEQCEEGQCVLACPETWRRSYGENLQELELHDGDLYVVGTGAQRGWVGALSPCTGDIVRTAAVSVTGATQSGLWSLYPHGQDLFVTGRVDVGTDAQVLAARLDAPTLGVTWSKSLQGSAETDEGWGIGVASDGMVWLGGKILHESGARPWTAKMTPTGDAACGFVIGAGGHGRAVAVGAASVYVAGSTDGKGSVVRFDASSCSTSSPCGCDPDWTAVPVELGTYTEIRTLQLVGSSLYAGGFAQQDGPDYAAFVVEVDIASGQTLATWLWNPTDLFDGVHGLTTDGTRLYAAMSTDTTIGDLTGAQAVVAALPTDLASSATPLWNTVLSGMNTAYDVAVDGAPDGPLFVVGKDMSAGWVVRCTKDGDCPW